MSKQIAISVSTDMYNRYQVVKEDFGLHLEEKGVRKITMSAVCREAIEAALIEAEAHYLYRQEGIQDGEKNAHLFAEDDRRYIARMLSNSGPYKKWSRFDKLEELRNHFENIKKYNLDDLYPKFDQIMGGITPPLHDWVEVSNQILAADRRSEVCWSYCAGCYEGIGREFIEQAD